MGTPQSGALRLPAPLSGEPRNKKPRTQFSCLPQQGRQEIKAVRHFPPCRRSRRASEASDYNKMPRTAPLKAVPRYRPSAANGEKCRLCPFPIPHSPFPNTPREIPDQARDDEEKAARRKCAVSRLTSARLMSSGANVAKKPPTPIPERVRLISSSPIPPDYPATYRCHYRKLRL